MPSALNHLSTRKLFDQKYMILDLPNIERNELTSDTLARIGCRVHPKQKLSIIPVSLTKKPTFIPDGERDHEREML
jgi:hypothetical protein